MQYLRNFYRIHDVPESQSWLLFVFRITFKEYCYDDTYGRSAKDLTCPSDFGNIANLILKRYFSSDQELNNAIFSIVIKTVHYSWKIFIAYLRLVCPLGLKSLMNWVFMFR
jgi:hypothetical protein